MYCREYNLVDGWVVEWMPLEVLFHFIFSHKYRFLFSFHWQLKLISSIQHQTKKKKRNFQNQSFPFLNNISRPEMNFIPGETFYSYTNLQIHTIKKTLIFTRRQVVLVVMAFVNIIFRSFISIKPRQDFNPTAATFSLLLLVV